MITFLLITVLAEAVALFYVVVELASVRGLAEQNNFDIETHFPVFLKRLDALVREAEKPTRKPRAKKETK